MRPTVPIPFALSSAPGASAQESGGRLINCYTEPLGDAAPKDSEGKSVVWRRSPGLALFATSGQTGFRGGILVNNLVFAAFSGKLVTVDNAGVVTVVGNLPGTKRVTFARNNTTPTPEIQCVDPDNGAFAVTTGSVTTFNGGGNLPVPNSVFGQDDYFFWTIADGRAFAAGPNSVTVNTQTFTTIRSRGNDTLLRGVPYLGVALFLKQKSIEVYHNTAETAPKFPYSRLKVIDRGLLGRNAIAGWEDGFARPHWVGDDFAVYRLNGLEPEKVSPPDLDRLIAATGKTNPDGIEASCYVHAGHLFWALSAPTWSWEFNLSTEKWNERDSFSAGLFTRWRATGGLNAFGKWIAGDLQTGNLAAIDDTVFNELGSPLRMRLESGLVQGFPVRQRVARADFNFVAGVGKASGTASQRNPRVAVSWSRDGGVHWGNALLRELGEQAQGRRRVFVTNAGQAEPIGHRWRLDVSDDVYAALMGGTQSINARAP